MRRSCNCIAAFQDLAQYIEEQQPDTQVQESYGKTLLGLATIQRVRDWVQENEATLLMEDLTDDLLLAMLWPLIAEVLGDKVIGKYLPPEGILPIALRWVGGESYLQIFHAWEANNGSIRWGTKTRKLKMDDVVSLCDNVIGYQSTLIVAAVAEMLAQVSGQEMAATAQTSLAYLVKRMKYGLSHPDEIAPYELGFADRVAVGRLRSVLRQTMQPVPIRSRLRDSDGTSAVLASLPRYFEECYDSVV